MSERIKKKAIYQIWSFITIYLRKNKYFKLPKRLFLSDFAKNYSLNPNKPHLCRLKQKKDMVEPNLFG